MNDDQSTEATELKQFYASCPKGVEGLLADELRELGAVNFKEHPSHLTFQGTLEVGYKACLHSRLANRIFLCLLDEHFSDVEDLYHKVNSIEWAWHYSLDNTFAVDCVARKSKAISHSGFGALKVKDAIVDYFSERYEKRPSVDKENPDYRVHAIVNGSQLKIGLDLSGRSLHQRGYRQTSGRAPIKENLAAALLIRSQWKALSDQGYWFHDPMCGTGTMLIEAAMIATDFAPGLLNPHFGFSKWKQHDSALWESVIDQAKIAHETKLPHVESRFIGTDQHRESLSLAAENIRASGLHAFIETQHQDIRQPKITAFSHKGLLLSNPPYAERLGEYNEVADLYRAFGEYVKTRCQNWEMGIITNELQFAKNIGVRSHKSYKFKNGALDCQLYLYRINKENEYIPFDPTQVNPNWEKGLSEQAIMFKNRLQKNQQRLKSYLTQNEVNCYRLYDADLPDYSAIIDVYGEQVRVEEYAPPKSIPEKVSQRRLNEMVRVSSGVLQIPEAKIIVSQKHKQTGPTHSNNSDEKEYNKVTEQGAQFYVDLTHEYDTGLKLDHRKVRKLVMNKLASSEQKRFLNLFAHTGAGSVYAALAGAKTTTVEMSKWNIDVARRNLVLNEVNVYQHALVQQDSFQWLQEQNTEEPFDVIWLDPPSFTGKGIDGEFDIHTGHGALLTKVMALLEQQGIAFFTTSAKKFTLDETLKERFVIHEITKKTLPTDFQKSKNHHRCWSIQHMS